MFHKLKIAARMTLLIVVGAGIILGAIITYSYVAARALLEEELREKAQNMARATACRIEIVERAVEKVVESAAFMLEDEQQSIKEQYHLLSELVSRNPEIYGACIAPAEIGEAPYAYHSPGGKRILEADLNADNYQYSQWSWFTEPRDLGRPIWTEPYYDEGGGNILMVTYSVPFSKVGKPNEFAGVVTSDVSLEWLGEMLAGLKVGNRGNAILISAKGAFIAHPNQDFVLNETVFTLAEKKNNPEAAELARRMINGESGFTLINSFVTGEPAWVAYAPDPATGWSVALIFPKDELLAKVAQLSRELLLFGVGGFALLLLMALLIGRSISRPLKELEVATHVLAKGDLDAPLPKIPGEDEVARLASSFETMRTDLKRHIADLQATTAAKERIESELQVARSIQMSLVPRTFPPFPEREDVELFALLEPAREIGGDFYDFFLADDENLCLVIGDVSGKGVPAALFMAVTRTFLRSLWNEEKSPVATIRRLNDELARGNEESMFVTLFCVTVHLPTGRCTFANGGHNPPFVMRHDGRVELVPQAKGTVVGAMEDMVFEEGHLKLEPDDVLFLYTDGVTEAMDPEDKLSGEEWAVGELEKVGPGASEATILGMREALRKFTRGAEQSDDITMLAFRYLGPQ